MKKLGKQLTAVLMTLTMLLVMGSSTAFAADATTTITRLYGDTRYETAFAVSDAMGQQSSSTGRIICSGTNFPDALSAASLGYANYKNDAILLVDTSTENNVSQDRVLNYLKEFNSTAQKGKLASITIMGGTAAVSQDFENSLTSFAKSSGMDASNVRRLSGETRYETNYATVYDTNWNNDGERTCQLDGSYATGDVLILVSGENYADALSAAAVGEAMMMVPSTGLKDYQSKYISKMVGYKAFKQIVIVGGTASVSETVENQVAAIIGKDNVLRLGGQDRFETSELVAEHFFPNAKTVILAYGGGFADALTAAPLAKKNSAPVLLTKECSAGETNFAKKYTNTLGDFNIIAVGGAGSTANPQLTDKAINDLKAGTITANKYEYKA